MGDVFIFSSETIQLIYEGTVLDYTVTNLRRLIDDFKVKNVGPDTAHDVVIIAVSPHNDEIRFQYQGGEWTEILRLGDLEPDEEKEFRLRVSRSFDGTNFAMRYFDLVIY